MNTVQHLPLLTSVFTSTITISKPGDDESSVIFIESMRPRLKLTTLTKKTKIRHSGIYTRLYYLYCSHKSNWTTKEFLNFCVRANGGGHNAVDN